MFPKCLNNLVLLMLIIGSCIIVVSANEQAQACQVNYNGNSFTGNWSFADFKTGPLSGDLYYLLSLPSNNKCAIIRDNTNGTQTWAKQYQSSDCGHLVIDGNESYIHYIVTNGSQTLSFVQVSCSDGAFHKYRSVDIANYQHVVSMTASLEVDLVYLIIKLTTNQTQLIRFDSQTETLYVKASYSPINDGTETGVEVHATSNNQLLYTSKTDSNAKLAYVMLNWWSNGTDWSVVYQ